MAPGVWVATDPCSTTATPTTIVRLLLLRPRLSGNASVTRNFAPVVSLAKVKGVGCKSGQWAVPGGTHTQKEGRIWNVLSAHSPKWVPYPGLDQLVEAMQAWLPNKQRLAHRAQTPLDYLAKKARYRRPPSPDPKHLLGQGARL